MARVLTEPVRAASLLQPASFFDRSWRPGEIEPWQRTIPRPVWEPWFGRWPVASTKKRLGP